MLIADLVLAYEEMVLRE